MDPQTLRMTLRIAASLLRSRTGRTLLVAVLVLQVGALAALAFGPAYLVGALSSSSTRQLWTSATTDAGTCDPLDAVGGGAEGDVPRVGDLTTAQVRVAKAFWVTALAVGRQQGWSSAVSERAAVVLLAVGQQESTMGAASGIERPNGDGDAGVLQQRTLPGWYGTLAQVNDPRYAARVFLLGKRVDQAGVAAARRAGSRPAGPVGYVIPGLRQVAGWERLPVTVAAQRVQRSAFPDAYAAHERLARGLVATFEQQLDPAEVEAELVAASTMCGAVGALDCPASGLAVENGLRPDALRVLRCVHQDFPQVSSWAGVGSRANPTDHTSGRAVDVMVPDYGSAAGAALGTRIARWVQANAAALGVSYVIWNSQIWSVERPDEGWRSCGTSRAGCYAGADDTAAHRDHVHVSTYGDSAGGGAPSGRVVLPVSGYHLTAGFGQCGSAWARCHTGQDFAVAAGTPIRAVEDGRVTFVGWGGAYGNLTKLQHADGTQTWYAHQLRQRVRVGEVVRAGQVIGAVGFTGNVRPAGPAGAHLHLEVRVDGSPVDPLAWLRTAGAL